MRVTPVDQPAPAGRVHTARFSRGQRQRDGGRAPKGFGVRETAAARMVGRPGETHLFRPARTAGTTAATHTATLVPRPVRRARVVVPRGLRGPGHRAGGACRPRVVLVRRGGHAQVGHRVLHRPGTGLVQHPAIRARAVRSHVRHRHANRHRHRHGADPSGRRRFYHGRDPRLYGRSAAGTGGRHTTVRRVLRGARPTQTVRFLAPVGHTVGIRPSVPVSNYK